MNDLLDYDNEFRYGGVTMVKAIVNWGHSDYDLEDYGRIVGGKYNGSLLRKDNWSMLMLDAGTWVRLTTITPVRVTTTRDSKKDQEKEYYKFLEELRERTTAILCL